MAGITDANVWSTLAKKKNVKLILRTVPIEAISQPSNKKIQGFSKSYVAYCNPKSYPTDMKQTNRNYNRYQHSVVQDGYTNIVPSKHVLMQTSTTRHQDISCPTKQNSYYDGGEPEEGGISARLAEMKIFATIMLNAWRKRREDVRSLNYELDQLQKKYIKAKNQLHSLDSVFRNKQKLNEKLNRQLQNAADGHQRMQSSLDTLTTSLISAKAEASILEQKLHAKELENDSMGYTLTETNSQLFKSMTQIRHLQTNLSCEQRTVQLLENQTNKLLNEITLHEITCKLMEEQHLGKLFKTDQELLKAKSEINRLETLLLGLKEKEFVVRDLKKSELDLRKEIDLLKSNNRSLQSELSKCLTARLKYFWIHYLAIHRNTLMLAHFCAFYLLPAIPPPRITKMSITASLENFMSNIRN